MSPILFVTLCSFLSSWTPVHSARILGVFTPYAKSHHQFIQPLMGALAEAGHEVVVYSHFPHKNPPANYTDVYLGDIPVMNSFVTKLILDSLEVPHWKGFDAIYELFKRLGERSIRNEKLQELLKSDEHFDLVMSETYFMQEFTVVFGHVFNATVIGVQSFATNKIVDRAMGNPLSLAYMPNTCCGLPPTMSFVERFLNVVFSLRQLWWTYDNDFIPNLELSIMRNFPDIPPLQELLDKVALMFINDHLTVDYAQPRTPNIIPVAGIHIAEPKQLPKDLKKFMDEASDGVILFSLGTYVPDELRPKEYFTTISRVFRQLKQRVLWKTRKEDIEEVPGNVMLATWLPQQDILAHPNCVLFITHGGLLSQHETIYNGVPVVTIPHVFDQHRNARLYVERGVGVTLELNELSESSLLSAIKKVLENKKYKDNMRQLSEIFKDRPLSPRDTVVYWTEYVLRHGASHLRPASTRLTWYQLASLDVLAVALLIILLTLGLVFYTLRTIMNIIFTKSHTDKRKVKAS